MSDSQFTPRLAQLLARHQAGHDSARAAILDHSVERLRFLAHQMFHWHTDLHAIDQTDDVLQKALVRLYKALEDIKPQTPRELLGLAARQIRWVLADLAQERAEEKAIVRDVARIAKVGEEPADLLEWSEFHDKVQDLPDDEREVFELLLYQGLNQDEVASLLDISPRTVKRRWQQAKLMLHSALRGDWPSLEGGRA